MEWLKRRRERLAVKLQETQRETPIPCSIVAHITFSLSRSWKTMEFLTAAAAKGAGSRKGRGAANSQFKSREKSKKRPLGYRDDDEGENENDINVSKLQVTVD